jgi:hypothetical protein
VGLDRPFEERQEGVAVAAGLALTDGNQSGPWLTCGVSVLGSTV